MDKKDYTYLLIIEKALIINNVKIFLKSKKKEQKHLLVVLESVFKTNNEKSNYEIDFY